MRRLLSHYGSLKDLEHFIGQMKRTWLRKPCCIIIRNGEMFYNWEWQRTSQQFDGKTATSQNVSFPYISFFPFSSFPFQRTHKKVMVNIRVHNCNTLFNCTMKTEKYWFEATQKQSPEPWLFLRFVYCLFVEGTKQIKYDSFIFDHRMPLTNRTNPWNIIDLIIERHRPRKFRILNTDINWELEVNCRWTLCRFSLDGHIFMGNPDPINVCWISFIPAISAC